MPHLYMHVGLMKTGTTYLQSVWRANRDALGAQQIYFPGAKGEPVQIFAVFDLLGHRPRGEREDRVLGQWHALTDAVATSAHPTTLLSVEYLASATVRQARRAVASFPDHDVHVIITARDLGRVLVSAWQEDIKNDRTWTWGEYVDALQDPDARTRDPARGFWLRHDLAAVAETWAAAVGAAHLHIVTVPRPGASADVLSRVGTVVGFDPQRLTAKPARSNESLSAPATEIVRRLNARLEHRLSQRQYDKVVKHTLTHGLPEPPPSERFALPEVDRPWVTAEARRLIDQVAAGGYDVVGDLDDLVPGEDARGRRPDQASDEELLEAAMQALTLITEKHATAWRDNRRQETPRVTVSSPLARVSGGIRGASYRLRRSGAGLADRNRLASKAMGLYMKARAAGRRRASSG